MFDLEMLENDRLPRMDKGQQTLDSSQLFNASTRDDEYYCRTATVNLNRMSRSSMENLIDGGQIYLLRNDFFVYGQSCLAQLIVFGLLFSVLKMEAVAQVV
jgi:hypothetical protein